MVTATMETQQEKSQQVCELREGETGREKNMEAGVEEKQ